MKASSTRQKTLDAAREAWGQQRNRGGTSEPDPHDAMRAAREAASAAVCAAASAKNAKSSRLYHSYSYAKFIAKECAAGATCAVCRAEGRVAWANAKARQLVWLVNRLLGIYPEGQ